MAGCLAVTADREEGHCGGGGCCGGGKGGVMYGGVCVGQSLLYIPASLVSALINIDGRTLRSLRVYTHKPQAPAVYAHRQVSCPLRSICVCVCAWWWWGGVSRSRGVKIGCALNSRQCLLQTGLVSMFIVARWSHHVTCARTNGRAVSTPPAEINVIIQQSM